jgi:hypothetical protein
MCKRLDGSLLCIIMDNFGYPMKYFPSNLKIIIKKSDLIVNLTLKDFKD